LSEVLLRCHSACKLIYDFFKLRYAEYSDDDGRVLRLKGVWEFLKETKLLSSRASIPQVDRLYQKGAKNHFSLKFKKSIVLPLVQAIKKGYAGKGGQLSKNKDEIGEKSEEESIEVVGEDEFERLPDLQALGGNNLFNEEHRMTLSSEVDIIECMKDPKDYEGVRSASLVRCLLRTECARRERDDS
jgi:hypothetical protein